MKRGISIVLLSALVGGLTAYAVVNVRSEQTVNVVDNTDGARFRTVNLSHDNWPDFTYAAESAVDAVVCVKVTSTQNSQPAPNSLLDFFFGKVRAAVFADKFLSVRLKGNRRVAVRTFVLCSVQCNHLLYQFYGLNTIPSFYHKFDFFVLVLLKFVCLFCILK